MGNVSVEVPSICPTFNIGTSAVLHSPSFHDACGTPEAFGMYTPHYFTV